MNVRLYADKHGERQTFFKIDREETPQGESFWFSILNENGATESHPYGFTTRERLEKLRDELIELLSFMGYPPVKK